MSHVRTRLESAIDADVLAVLISADTPLRADDIAGHARLCTDRADLHDSIRRLQRRGAIQRVAVHGWTHYAVLAAGRLIRAQLASAGRTAVPDDQRPPISQRLIHQIADTPGLNASELGRAIGCTQNTTTGVLKNLTDAGRLDRLKVGSTLRYYPAGDAPESEVHALVEEAAHV